MIRPAEFRPAWWLHGAHAQTIWAAMLRRRPAISFRRERLELADGDFIDLDWTPNDSKAPLVLVLHGLEGSSRSNYICGLLTACMQRGWRGVVLHFRGCSGEPNRLARSYNAGVSADLDEVINHLRRRDPGVRLTAVGYSLGGNVLLKWLGEQGERAALRAAAAVSVPFLLEGVASRMREGFSRLYQRYFLNSMLSNYRAKFERITTLPPPLAFDQLGRLNDFYSFDDHITAPLHGFSDARDYYTRSSCRQYLHAIRRPTLIVHALDDPFMTTAVLPNPDELANDVMLELSEYGGHVGFVGGRWPWRAQFWLEQRIPAFLQKYLENNT
jgi:predicted alpha/beta-fold hydrolase